MEVRVEFFMNLLDFSYLEHNCRYKELHLRAVKLQVNAVLIPEVMIV